MEPAWNQPIGSRGETGFTESHEQLVNAIPHLDDEVLLRAGRLSEVDLEAVADELNSLGRGHRLRTHLRDLCVWFMAWNYAVPQRLAHPHWYVRTVQERVQIEVIVGTSPSLRPTLAADLADAWGHGREVASEGAGLPLETFPETCPWTAEQILDKDFSPGDAGGAR